MSVHGMSSWRTPWCLVFSGPRTIAQEVERETLSDLEELAAATSTHILLAQASHMTMSSINRVRKYTPLEVGRVRWSKYLLSNNIIYQMTPILFFFSWRATTQSNTSLWKYYLLWMNGENVPFKARRFSPLLKWGTWGSRKGSDWLHSHRNQPVWLLFCLLHIRN